MRPVNAKRLNYKDEAVRRHRRVFIFKTVAIIAGTVFVVAGLIYVFFFSRLFDVREVSFNGLDTINSSVLQGKINEQLDQKIFKFLPRRNNILSVDTDTIEERFSSAYPVFKSVTVKKKLPHGLDLNFIERKPSGIWCFKDGDSVALAVSCSYFDEDRVLWGESSKTSGFIFLTIEDQREKDTRQIDDDFFGPIMEVAKSRAGEIRSIIIPDKSFGEFHVFTSNYYIIFTTEFDIKNQLDVLRIFLDDKEKDPPPIGGFHPQYIDLRIDGRVYYK